MKVSVRFAWYELWVGVYWDRRTATAYACLLPMFPARLQFRRRVLCSKFGCHQPATMICVRKGDNWGEDFNRLPLCDLHGELGLCPDLNGKYDKHIPIVRKWQYVETDWISAWEPRK